MAQAPPKPWEVAGGSTGPSPFRPPSDGPTSTVVETAGVGKEQVDSNSDAQRNAALVNRTAVGRAMPTRPWERNPGTSYGNTYGGYNTLSSYNSGYGSTPYGGTNNSYGRPTTYGGGLYGGSTGGLYGGSTGGLYGGSTGGLYGGGSYGGGLYGNNMYRGGSYGGAGGMYNNGLGGPMGGYGMGGGPFDNGMNGADPNDPFGGGPPTPPNFWQSMMRVMHGVVSFLGRIAMLIDENTQAFHFFVTALLQLFDRSGVLYGELARFVLRILGIRTKPKAPPGPGANPIAGPGGPNNYYIEGPKEPVGGWDNVWGSPN